MHSVIYSSKQRFKDALHTSKIIIVDLFPSENFIRPSVRLHTSICRKVTSKP